MDTTTINYFGWIPFAIVFNVWVFTVLFPHFSIEKGQIVPVPNYIVSFYQVFTVTLSVCKYNSAHWLVWPPWITPDKSVLYLGIVTVITMYTSTWEVFNGRLSNIHIWWIFDWYSVAKVIWEFFTKAITSSFIPLTIILLPAILLSFKPSTTCFVISACDTMTIFRRLSACDSYGWSVDFKFIDFDAFWVFNQNAWRTIRL